MSSELHDLIEKELQAADVRLDASERVNSGATRTGGGLHSTSYGLPRSPAERAGDCAALVAGWARDAVAWAKASYASACPARPCRAVLDATLCGLCLVRRGLRLAPACAAPLTSPASSSCAAHPFRWKVCGTVVFIVLVLTVALSSGGSGVASMAGMAPGGGSHKQHSSVPETPQLHYVRTRQGIDPEAVASLVIAGVHKGGATDLYRRLLARFPALQPGAYRELNFLTQCQSDPSELLAYRNSHRHCDAPLNNGSADPACHGCTPLGYGALFNTSGVSARLGKCAFPLTSQSICAGGALLPDADATKSGTEGYTPVFTVDASVKAYASSVGAAYRAASTLSKVSPRSKIILLLRSPADVPRAVYNAKLEAECGSHQCSGTGNGTAGGVPSYETLIARELAYLTNTTKGIANLAALVGADSVKAAKRAEEQLQVDWSAYAVAHRFPPIVWDHALWSLHGLYGPLIQAWSDKFVVPGRPMLVLQSEAYFSDPGGMVDALVGPFLFGDDDAAAVFATGGASGQAVAAPQRKYGSKASQSVGQRCALYEMLKQPTKQLEQLLTRLQKEGKVQLRRAHATGPLWPRPAECGVNPDGSQAAPTEAADYLDYAEGLGGQQDSYGAWHEAALTALLLWRGVARWPVDPCVCSLPVLLSSAGLRLRVQPPGIDHFLRVKLALLPPVWAVKATVASVVSSHSPSPASTHPHMRGRRMQAGRRSLR